MKPCPKPVPAEKKRRRGTKTSKRLAQRKATKAMCDKAWADYIKRGGKCMFAGQPLAMLPYLPFDDDEEGGGWANDCEGPQWDPHVCKGYLQAMHGIPKGPYPSARYELWNGFPGCAAAHVYYTHRPELWTLFLQKQWGADVFAERMRAANHPAKHDYDAVLAKLRAL